MSLGTLQAQTTQRLWTWGMNNAGQLGDGTTTNKLSPVQIEKATNSESVAGGEYHTVAIKADGSLWTWGFNYYGQLGDGTTTNRNSPAQIGTTPIWTSVAAGRYHTLAFSTDISTALPTLSKSQQDSYSGSSIAVDFSLPETAKTGTVQLTFSHSGGTADANSPHIITLDATFETAGQHTLTLNGSSLSSAPGVVSVSSAPNDALSNGGTYTVTISYQDEIGNPASKG